MRITLGTILFLATCQISLCQVDSLEISSLIDSEKFHGNSVPQDLQGRMDSLANLNGIDETRIVADTIALIHMQLDSIQTGLNTKVDSITNSYSSVLTSIQTSAQRFESKIDSLKAQKLPIDKYKAKMDSLSQRYTSVQQEVNEKIEGIKTKATKKIKSINYPPELEDKVSKLTSSIESLGPQTIESKLPAGLNLDKLNALKNPLSANNLGNLANVKVPELPQVNGLTQTNTIPDLKSSIPDVKGMDQVSNVTGEVQAVQGKLDVVKDLNPGTIDKLAESKVSQLDEVKALQEQSTLLPMTPPASEEEMKSKLKEQAQKVAVDHFAGKQEQLKAAMDKIAKYKTKYPSVSSIADVAKRPPNAMRNKPLIERIVPGIGFQILRKGEDFMVDFNPYIGYRFTGRITAGPGWNQRVAYNFDHKNFNQSASIFGPRIFGEFKLGKGFSPRVEFEVMNTKVPPAFVNPAIDPQNRDWVWGAFLGIKKEYKLVKSVKGTASVMTRVFNPDRKSPYADVLNVRFGFEFSVKRKLKK